MSEASKAPVSRDFATHRRARHEYVLLEKMEAGIELLGAEVKAIRDGQASLAESFGDVEGGQLYLRDLTIQPYRFARAFTADPSRPRRLLVHRREIDRIQGLIAAGGVTLIPLRLYARKGRVKVELALCRGKQHADKRETIRSRTAAREADRDIASRGRA